MTAEPPAATTGSAPVPAASAATPAAAVGDRAHPTDAPLDPDRLARATLASLPAMTCARMRALLDAFGGGAPALEAVRQGRAPAALRGVDGSVLEAARAWAGRADPTGVARLLARRGTRVHLDDDPDFPVPDDVPAKPPLLFGEGDRPDVLARPCVAIVGTRAASPHGLADARDLGGALAEAGYTVVSGLAIGIDGAAHEGALAAGGGVAGVVGTGLDVVYPRRHGVLFRQVREHGVLLGEYWFGTPPAQWRFPVRNRIIAAVSLAVVVVEAHRQGGALDTARHAVDMGREVLAVPGSRRNPAAAGTNRLVADGAIPVLEPADVLTALGRAGEGRRWSAPRSRPVGPDGRALLRALGGEPATIDQVAGRSGMSVAAVAGAARELEDAGLLERARGLLWPR